MKVEKESSTKVRWIRIGKFNVPARRELSEEERAKVEEILSEFVASIPKPTTPYHPYPMDDETVEELKKFGVVMRRRNEERKGKSNGR